MTEVTSLPAPRRRGVTFTYGDCNNRMLHNALEKLDNYTGFTAADLSRFNKIKHYYDSNSKHVSQLFNKLIKKHAAHEPATRKGKDGKQVPLLTKDGKPVMKPVMVPNSQGRMDFLFKSRADFNKDYQELMTETFEVEATLLLTEDLVKAGLSPKEIRACGKIISDFDQDLVMDTPVVLDDAEDELEAAEDLDQDDPPEAENSDAAASLPPGLTCDSSDAGNASASL